MVYGKIGVWGGSKVEGGCVVEISEHSEIFKLKTWTCTKIL